jgi:hypothetical protein
VACERIVLTLGAGEFRGEFIGQLALRAGLHRSDCARALAAL